MQAFQKVKSFKRWEGNRCLKVEKNDKAFLCNNQVQVINK